MIKLLLQFLATVWLYWFVLAPSMWAQIQFTADPTGTQEVPPNVAVTGRGIGTFTLTGQELAFKVTVDGLTGPIAMAHFHNAAVGVDGAVVKTITADFVGNIASGIWKSTDPEPLTQALINELQAGRLYVNIHTASFPGGEIRGQLGPATLVSAVLPASRSVQVGVPATAFATIINAATSTAIGCGITPIPNIPATFSYQTTNPATNQITGTPNTPVDIPTGLFQTYVFSLTPNAPITPVDLQFSFDCVNTNPAPITVGVNTLLFTASATPVPDVVALAGTPAPEPGIVNIPGTTGTGFFVVATVNVGASGSITASADTGGTVLPVNISLCQTNPTTGACLAPPASSVTTTINAGATPTFGIFVQGTGNVLFNPATNRIFTRFKDNGGVTRGSTSVAVRTVTAPGSFAGTYSGIFSGDDSGTWAVVVDASGNLTGSGFSNDIGNFNISGNVTASGAVFFTAGTVTTGASFSGMISASGVVSGAWVNTYYGVSGTFSGSKQ